MKLLKKGHRRSKKKKERIRKQTVIKITMKKEFQEKDALDRQGKGFKQVTNRFWVSMMYSVMM